jgi:hypothetical protein
VQKHTKLFFRLRRIHYFKLSHVVPKFLFFFFLKPLRFNIIPSLLPFSLTFLLVPSASYLRSYVPLCTSFPGFHFLCPSTFFFVLFPFPLSPSPIPPPTEKSLISPFLHSISTVPLLLLFFYIPLLLYSFPFFLLSRGFLVSSVSLVLVL